MIANETYVGHRTGCGECFAVDNHLGGSRCEQGKLLVRGAATEGRRQRLRMVMATDFVFLREIGISYP